MHSDAAIPPHLRQYVVEQDYGQYTARDQAVWRFVLTHTHARLLQAAHPAYAAGFERAGISTDRIPELAHMDERLRASGFRVVCVDGFIPPRAFQGFQARGVLPVAADIRAGEHLTYTPAPDIIHEAAGHAPLLPDPDYARFLRRVGAASEHAFETSHDRAVYRAIYALSELKEHPQSTREQIATAEAELTRLHAAGRGVSEATRMARFYWWTVEYGLAGTPTDYRLYGAGLLSSIGEAHFCHDERVKKLPLDARCTEVDYDITQAQPQLFVARDFQHLEQVLEEVERGLSHARGGQEALQRALESDELATITTDGGLQVAGKVQAFSEGWVELEGPCALARDGALLPDLERLARYLLPLGELEDGTPLSALSAERLRGACDARGKLALRTRAGLAIEGTLGELSLNAGRVQLANLRECQIAHGDEVLLRSSATYPLLLAQRVATASPVLPAGYLPATPYSGVRVPKPRSYASSEQTLITLHTKAAELRRAAPGDALAEAKLSAMYSVLAHRYPSEWLLRFNLLEALQALGAGQTPLARDVEHELEQLELYFNGREPIATGLAYLRGTHPLPARDSWAGALRHSGAARRTR